jgi:putative sterol carrier protein
MGLPLRVFFEDQLPGLVGPAGRNFLPEDVVVAFHLSGEGGGSWQVARGADPRLRVSALEPGPKDCTVRMDAADFLALLNGELEPRRAFVSGRMEIEGDIGLVLRLQEVVRSLAA